ncbi:AP-3 complex subunit delta-1 [Homalodisca vitripennis]|nr:AP-3 complex subunit delta-1 [Homalodisca vitripennis]
MSKILKSHPKSVQSHKDLVMQCLDDKDESIRLRALDLLYGMVSRKTLIEIVKKLMVHMDKAEGTSYRDELLSKIIDICSQNNYQYITNFEWWSWPDSMASKKPKGLHPSVLQGYVKKLVYAEKILDIDHFCQILLAIVA